MKLVAFLLGGALAAMTQGQYEAGAALFIVGALVLVHHLPPSGCNQACDQGHACTCGKDTAEDFT